jgi:hypothetical protein
MYSPSEPRIILSNFNWYNNCDLKCSFSIQASYTVIITSTKFKWTLVLSFDLDLAVKYYIWEVTGITWLQNPIANIWCWCSELSSGLYCRVKWLSTDVSEVRTASIIRDEYFTFSSLMMEAVRTSETSVDNQFTRQYNPKDSSEHHTRRRENLKSHIWCWVSDAVFG